MKGTILYHQLAFVHFAPNCTRLRKRVIDYSLSSPAVTVADENLV